MSSHSHKHHRHSERTKKRGEKNKLVPTALGLIVIFTIGAGALIYWFGIKDSTPKPAVNQETVLNQHLIEPESTSQTLKTFTGEEFKSLYNSYAYPNTEYIAEDAVITGDAKTDELIRQRAEERGYLRRSAPVQDVFVEVETNMKLQERASEPWKRLKEAAKKENIDLFLTAAYRSAEEQRSIFLDRIGGAEKTTTLLNTGTLQREVDTILATTAIPGYSRHHTGYTIDIGCGNDPVTTFDFTVCFEWLSADNYKNAKTFGWIPSYPEGAGQQGPEPETWEYVWVGENAVRE